MKKLFALFLALSLFFCNSIDTCAESENVQTLVGRYDSTISENPIGISVDAGTIIELINTEAMEGAFVILDVRSAANYKKGHIKGAVSAPLFTESNGLGTSEEVEAFKQTINENRDMLESKPVFILCNAGAMGAKAASVLLSDANISLSQVHIITKGASDAAIRKEFKYVNYDYALSAEGMILDVRSDDAYYKTGTGNGYVDGSLHQPLYSNVNGSDVVTNLNDNLAKEFQAFVDANMEYMFLQNNIFLLCKDGTAGSKAAMNLLNEKGLLKVLIIEDGASGKIKESFKNNQLDITAQDLLDATNDLDIVILDVRAAGDYQKGHLKGALNSPLSAVEDDEQKVSSGYDKQAMDFLKFIKNNSSEFADKQIYVLGNDGTNDAKAATKLLMQAGYSTLNIHTVPGGYSGNADIEESSIYVTPTQAMKDIETADADNLLIDIRAAKDYADGHVKDSVSFPLFDAEGNLSDELVKEFEELIKANADVFNGQTVYIVYEYGSEGAEKAAKLLDELGIDSVRIIEGDDLFEELAPYLTETKSETLEDFIEGDNGGSNSGADTDNGTEEEPEAKPVIKTDSKAAKTGDTANIMGYALAMACSLLIIICVSKKKFTI